jgi:hypothetical protein
LNTTNNEDGRKATGTDPNWRNGFFCGGGHAWAVERLIVVGGYEMRKMKDDERKIYGEV